MLTQAEVNLKNISYTQAVITAYIQNMGYEVGITEFDGIHFDVTVTSMEGDHHTVNVKVVQPKTTKTKLDELTGELRIYVEATKIPDEPEVRAIFRSNLDGQFNNNDIAQEIVRVATTQIIHSKIDLDRTQRLEHWKQAWEKIHPQMDVEANARNVHITPDGFSLTLHGLSSAELIHIINTAKQHNINVT